MFGSNLDGELAPADVLLGAIAAPFLAAIALGATAAVPMSYALGAASLPAGGGVGYALFGDLPTDQ